jgi:hypothetical protein
MRSVGALPHTHQDAVTSRTPEKRSKGDEYCCHRNLFPLVSQRRPDGDPNGGAKTSLSFLPAGALRAEYSTVALVPSLDKSTYRNVAFWALLRMTTRFA